MKIKDADLQALRAAVCPLDTDARRNRYRRGDFPHATRVKDLSKRYRWDLIHDSGLKIGDGVGMSGLPLYAYLNDDHIDTALRSLVPDITRSAPVAQ